MHFKPTTCFVIPHDPVGLLTDTAPTYQYMQRIFEAQVDIDNHPDVDIGLLEDSLISAIQHMELADQHVIPSSVIPWDMPDLQDLVQSSGDNATLNELLFYYAVLLKVGGTKWICQKVRDKPEAVMARDDRLVFSVKGRWFHCHRNILGKDLHARKLLSIQAAIGTVLED